MDDSSYTTRLIFAAILCFGVIIVWEQLFPSTPLPPPPEVAKVEDAGVRTSTKAAPAVEPPSLVAGSTTAAPAGAMPEIAEETFQFRGHAVSDDGKSIPYELTLTNVGGALERFELPEYFERGSDSKETQRPIALAEGMLGAELENQMAGIELVGASTFRLPKRPVYEVVDKSDTRILYRYTTPDGIVVEREYSLSPDSFEIELAVTVRNGSIRPQSHQLQINSVLKKGEAAKGQLFFMPPPDHLSGICYTNGKVQRETHESLTEEVQDYDEGVKWVAMDRQYFVAALIQRDGVEARCELSAHGEYAEASLILPEVRLDPGQEKRHKFSAYLGVKKPELLTRLDSQLESAIDYTIMGLNLAIVCEALLMLMGAIHGFTKSWGLAILGLTVLVKGVLFPLNQRSGKSMRSMSALKPEMESIREKFKDDRQRQSEEMMKLYQKHSVNPASGCVPILIQMPIWFALYRSLWVSVDLYQTNFMWIPDLTAKDPFYILPVLLIGVMFVQQKMTPTAMDPTQQKIMQYLMPLMFGGMMIGLPAGLVFYILVNSLLTIVQQHFINRSLGPMGGPPSLLASGQSGQYARPPGG